MTSTDLQARIQATKSLLQREIVRNKIDPTNSTLSFREIGVRLDMIHEAERVGVRNLGEYQDRKLRRMMSELESKGITNEN